MEESKELQKLYSFMQVAVYFTVILDVIINIFLPQVVLGRVSVIFARLTTIPVFGVPLYTKIFTLVLICLVGIGTRAQKDLELNPRKQIIIPMAIGLVTLFTSLFFISEQHPQEKVHVGLDEACYILFSFAGALITNISIDNISKLIKSGFGKDKWNVEEESFMQDKEALKSPTSINIPMKFYCDKKVYDGFINLNPFRGTMVIGTPGSGKSFGVINPTIRQMLAKNFTMCLYDFKFPDLAQIAYYHYLLAKKRNDIPNLKFQVINLDDVTKSSRVNPLKKEYVKTLAEAQEISEALVEALKKGSGSGGGADQFFTQSAINFLACSVYFFAQYDNGRYSTLPHIMSFINQPYDKVFPVLFSNPELHSLLSPFKSAFEKKAFDQLEGQIGTLKIFISRLSTKESFWVFTGDDVNLKISDKDNPGILILANNPATQNINSALYALVINRLVRLINSKGNHPCAIIADEVPTLFIHKVENLIATARSNKVAVMMGLQELPQFKQQYGRETAETISSVIGNILSGSVRNKETLDWLERLFGKVKQKGHSLNIDRNRTTSGMSEKIDSLIPAGKIASLKTGEMVGILAKDVPDEYTGEYVSSAVNCKINLDLKEIQYEEKNYPPMPYYYTFKDKAGNDNMNSILIKNFTNINEQVAKAVDLILTQMHEGI
ncbi:MAG: type IV secretion system DNA-binding domain-containing protein [Prolixibacteraceae bacterium]|nr:type IV secretion system DNA-binding domain-containing protein [Prolixibacteraceae bacterium]